MAIFYTRGKIAEMTEVRTGTSAKGNQWANMDIVLEEPGYKGMVTKIKVQVGTDRVDDVLKFKLGDKVEVGWVIRATEFKGRWYNNVELVNVKAIETSSYEPTAAPALPDDEKGDLPF